MNIVDEIFRGCDRGAEALVHGVDRLSYGELEVLLDQSAARLRQTGCFERRSVRVGLSCPNGFGHVVWSLAVLRCGGVLVPVPGELTAVEREALVEATGVEVVLEADGQRWHRDEVQAHDLAGGARLLEVEKRCDVGFDADAFEALEPALVRFSSGTTGESKGVVLSHRTLYERVRASNSRLGIGRGDRVVWMLPMAHHFAVSIVLYLLHGAVTVIVDSHLAEDVIEALAEERGTVVYAAPFHYAMLAGWKGEAGDQLGALRLAVSTAAALPAAVGEAFGEKFGVPLRQGLGIIEVGLPVLNWRWAEEKPGSVGEAQEGYEFELREVDGDGVGELFLRGPGMFDAYLVPWALRESVVDEGGWFATGDLGTVDGDGALTLVGRTKSVINVGGMKVFAEEVEAVLREHEAVAEVRVVGVAHPAVGAVPVAEVVLADGVEAPRKPALLGWCRERLSNYKVPVRVVYVESLPMTASGKMRRVG